MWSYLRRTALSDIMLLSKYCTVESCKVLQSNILFDVVQVFFLFIHFFLFVLLFFFFASWTVNCWGLCPWFLPRPLHHVYFLHWKSDRREWCTRINCTLIRHVLVSIHCFYVIFHSYFPEIEPLNILVPVVYSLLPMYRDSYTHLNI